MTRAEITAHNIGVATVVALAAASADALRLRLTAAPTRYNFAIEALAAIVDASAELMLSPPPNGAAAIAASLPKSTPPTASGANEVVQNAC